MFFDKILSVITGSIPYVLITVDSVTDDNVEAEMTIGNGISVPGAIELLEHMIEKLRATSVDVTDVQELYED